MNTEDIQSLKITLVEINNDLKSMVQKQEDLHNDIRDVKSAIYNPDSGLYARLRALEQWKESQAKIQWMIITSILGLMIATIYKAIFTL